MQADLVCQCFCGHLSALRHVCSRGTLCQLHSRALGRRRRPQPTGRAPSRAAAAAAGAAPLGGASESPAPKAAARGARAAASSATGAGGAPHAAGDPPGPAPVATWAQGQQVCERAV